MGIESLEKRKVAYDDALTSLSEHVVTLTMEKLDKFPEADAAAARTRIAIQFQEAIEAAARHELTKLDEFIERADQAANTSTTLILGQDGASEEDLEMYVLHVMMNKDNVKVLESLYESLVALNPRHEVS